MNIINTHLRWGHWTCLCFQNPPYLVNKCHCWYSNTNNNSSRCHRNHRKPSCSQWFTHLLSIVFLECLAFQCTCTSPRSNGSTSPFANTKRWWNHWMPYMTRSNCWRHLPICLPHPAPAVCTASKLFKILESRFVSVADPPKLSELRVRFTIGSNHNPNITRLATPCLMFFYTRRNNTCPTDNTNYESNRHLNDNQCNADKHVAVKREMIQDI
jgi:hypothetical protein